MKQIAFAFAVLIASVSAVPQPVSIRDEKQNRILDDVIVSLIDDLRALIVEAGLDPYQLDYAEGSWELPIPEYTFSAWGYGQDVQLTGLSNIVVNSVSYDILSGRLTLDVSMPEISGSVGSAAGRVNVLEHEISGNGNGALTITGIRVKVDTTVRVSLSGISISSFIFEGSIENISSDITLVILDNDLSDIVNGLLNETILEYLNEYADEINELLSYYILRILEWIL